MIDPKPEHFKSHAKDNHSRRGLRLVNDWHAWDTSCAISISSCARLRAGLERPIRRLDGRDHLHKLCRWSNSLFLKRKLLKRRWRRSRAKSSDLAVGEAPIEF